MATPDMDLENWMSKLPPPLWDEPLFNLVIPGSHDSFSFSIDRHSEIGPDVPGAVKIFGPCFKGVVYNWSRSQSMDISQQLVGGVRYFDMRVAWRAPQAFHLLHCLYGMTVEQSVKDIVSYLKQHEIVIIDFNHFYSMTERRHNELVQLLQDWCGDLLYKGGDKTHLNLKTLWQKNIQVLISYKNFDSHFGSLIIESPWANTTDSETLFRFLDNTLDKHRGDMFHVSQGILTADATCIVKHVCSTLKRTFAVPIMPHLLQWIKTKQRGAPDGLNIVIADFVELDDFAKCVVGLNYN